MATANVPRSVLVCGTRTVVGDGLESRSAIDNQTIHPTGQTARVCPLEGLATGLRVDQSVDFRGGGTSGAPRQVASAAEIELPI